ncbi:hypothetical protein PIB30_099575, partial [Stylosanthes scabra]|nr:hypothetical protein [Stylosanthes scabra]
QFVSDDTGAFAPLDFAGIAGNLYRSHIVAAAVENVGVAAQSVVVAQSDAQNVGAALGLDQYQHFQLFGMKGRSY